MYKVFINEKPLILTDRVAEHENCMGVQQYYYTGQSNLKQVIEKFDQDKETSKLVIINSENFNLLHNAFLSLFTPITAAGGIVYHPHKGMLWIFRHNRWDLPKGKIDPHESIGHAAIREVKEETGLRSVKITHSLGSTQHAYHEKKLFILKTSHWFAMETDNPDTMLIPQINEGITLVEWAKESTVQAKISNTWANIQELASDFVTKYTGWKIR